MAETFIVQKTEAIIDGLRYQTYVKESLALDLTFEYLAVKTIKGVIVEAKWFREYLPASLWCLANC